MGTKIVFTWGGKKYNTTVMASGHLTLKGKHYSPTRLGHVITGEEKYNWGKFWRSWELKS